MLNFQVTKKQSGVMLIHIIITIAVFAILVLPLLNFLVLRIGFLRSAVAREQALQIAEAGVNYFQWHLAHYPEDYVNGAGLHDYVDADTQQAVGQYNLAITAPPSGSTIVTIQSTGWTNEEPGVTRTVTVQYGIPSLAQYSLLINSYVNVGATSTYYGKFHSNSGIQFNGTATAEVSSASPGGTYTCQDGDGCSGTHDAIWGTGGPQAFWNYPVSNFSFDGITFDLGEIQEGADGSGIYLPESSVDAPRGYSLVFNSNGTVSIYGVKTLRSHATGYDSGVSHSEDLDYNTRTKLDGDPNISGVQDFAIPANGLIFVGDDAWVEGTVHGRVTVAVAKLGETLLSNMPSILIPNNIVYSAKDGTDVLGLISQGNVLMTYYVPNNLEIDAALIAQNGAFKRYCFPNSLKDTLTVFGSRTSFGRTYSSSSCQGSSSGFPTRNYIYDSNLLYAPPPSYPVSTDGYQQLNWESN